MTAIVSYDNPDEAVVVTPVSFVNYSTGVAADPSSVSCVVTDPLGNITTYTYSVGSGLNAIVRLSTGNYSLTLDGLTSSGLWTDVERFEYGAKNPYLDSRAAELYSAMAEAADACVEWYEEIAAKATELAAHLRKLADDDRVV